MKVDQNLWAHAKWDKEFVPGLRPHLCLLFGSRLTIELDFKRATEQLRSVYPGANLVTVSTAGNIMNDSLIDDAIVATCIELEKTRIRTGSFTLGDEEDEILGARVAAFFDSDDLSYLMLFSTSGVNAGNILKGINSVYKGKVPVSGGVAGDDARFEKTLVGINEEVNADQIVGVVFYGTDLIVSHGSKGGWDKFGPIRKVTKAEGNLLFELDHEPVLDLYKKYLGDKAKDLPASGLLFPMCIIEDETREPIVRGIQNIDESKNALLLYGDIEEGQNVQLMRANFDELITGASNSARETFEVNKGEPELALLISCVARRIVLGQMTEEELLETKKIFGPKTALCGFYSYSELSPVLGDNTCHLHNQTMTITTFREK